MIAGLAVAAAVIDAVCGPDASEFEYLVADGDRVQPGPVAAVTAPTRLLLTAERTSLNLLCHMSGVATLTRRWADALNGTNAKVRDTRKTLPGLRALQKYAVRCGGGVNHRMSLSDAALVKDNHVLAAGGVAEAFAAVRALAASIPVEIEVDSLDGLREAIEAGADVIMLDNFKPEQMVEAVALRDRTAPNVVIEASGGLTLDAAACSAAKPAWTTSPSASSPTRSRCSTSVSTCSRLRVSRQKTRDEVEHQDQIGRRWQTELVLPSGPKASREGITTWRRPPTFMPSTPLLEAGERLPLTGYEHQRRARIPRRVELLAIGGAEGHELHCDASDRV